MEFEEGAFERFANGDTGDEAFEAALPEWERQIRKYLSFFGTRIASLEDLAQEAIIRVYLNRARLSGKGPPRVRAYLRRICRNLVVDDYRARRSAAGGKTDQHHPEGSGNKNDPPRRTGSPKSFVDVANMPGREHDAGLREALERCIENLREPDHTVFELRFREGLTPQNIAILFERTTRWCQMIIARAREALAECLRKQEFDVSP